MAWITGILAGTGVSGALQVPMEILNYELSAIAKHRPFDPTALVNSLRRGEISEQVFLSEFNKNGFTDEKASQFYNISLGTQGVMEIIARLRRKIITMEDAEKEAEFIGFSPEQMHKVEEATRIYYSPQDLIRFLVREVYTPEIRERFRQDEEFPEQAIEKAAIIGMSSEVVRDYWAAHWELPSIQQGYEMFYRFRPEDRPQWENEMKEMGIIPDTVETNIDDITTLQRTADMNPFWRSRQLGIAFRPLTIRMLRQQVRLRILNYDQTIYQFKKMGFSDRDAQRNTWFAIIFESITEWREMLKAQEITEEEIRAELVDWRVPPNIIEDIWKRKLEPSLEGQVVEEKGLLKSETKKRFLLDLDTRDESLELLRLLKYNEKTAKMIIEVWELEKEGKKQKDRNLSKTDLFKSFDAGKRTEASLATGLNEIGFSEEATKELIEVHKIRKKDKEAKL